LIVDPDCRDKIDSITDTLRGKKKKPKVCEPDQEDSARQVDDPPKAVDDLQENNSGR
jgi:hypothetical protein